jgi:hypothetical protein
LNVQDELNPLKDFADWGKSSDPAGHIVRHLRNREKANKPLVCLL